MIQTISYSDIEGKYDSENSNWGSSAKVFFMVEGEDFNNMVYKNYLWPIALDRKTSRNITYLEHLTNLANINSEVLMTPKVAVTNPLAIVGIVMNKAPGELLSNQNISISQLVNVQNQIREAIIDISTQFEIFDLNAGSIFFSFDEGITLVDSESYMEASGDYSFINLYRFYTKIVEILNYVPELKARICEELKRGIDFCRLEAIYDVVMQYLKEHNLKEEEAKVLVKK